MARDKQVLRRRHSAQLKAQVLAQCAAPGASVAKVAKMHGLNANIVHGWRKLAREGGQPAAAAVNEPIPASVTSPASPPQFVPVSMTAIVPPLAVGVEIQIELRRGATAMKITWPLAAAAECAAWMRELLR